MPSKQPGPNSEHRVATYNKGCRCDQCKDAMNKASRALRSRKRVREGGERLLRCAECGLTFTGERGLNVHRSWVH